MLVKYLLDLHFEQKVSAAIGSLYRFVSISQAIPISTFALGVWQIKRRTWKINLLKELEEKTTADPIPLPDE